MPSSYRCGRCKTTKPENDFNPSQRSNGKWCKECLKQWHRERAGTPPTSRDCAYCGTHISAPSKHAQKFCSANCKQRALYWQRNPRSSRQCENCADPIPAERRAGARYCSDRCANALRNRAKTPGDRRRSRLLATYGITLERYDELVAVQRGRCAICGVDTPSTHHGFWQVDHCHTNGHVRGLLCSPCNIGLGQFKDQPKILRSAARYLESTGPR